jgi:hypothetical protein
VNLEAWLQTLLTAVAAGGMAWGAVKAELHAMRRDLDRHEQELRELRQVRRLSRATDAS